MKRLTLILLAIMAANSSSTCLQAGDYVDDVYYWPKAKIVRTKIVSKKADKRPAIKAQTESVPQQPVINAPKVQEDTIRSIRFTHVADTTVTIIIHRP